MDIKNDSNNSKTDSNSNNNKNDSNNKNSNNTGSGQQTERMIATVITVRITVIRTAITQNLDNGQKDWQ